MNLNYDAVCKLVGNLYINGAMTTEKYEAQIRDLLAVNKRLQKSLDDVSATKEPVDELPTEGTVN